MTFLQKNHMRVNTWLYCRCLVRAIFLSKPNKRVQRQRILRSAQKGTNKTTHRNINLNHIDLIVLLFLIALEDFERLNMFRSSGKSTIRSYYLRRSADCLLLYRCVDFCFFFMQTSTICLVVVIVESRRLRRVDDEEEWNAKRWWRKKTEYAVIVRALFRMRQLIPNQTNEK